MHFPRHTTTNSPACAQVRVVGALLGAWGLQRYGKKPAKVDALDFYPARLAELRRLIREAEPAARCDFYPAAFVTFRCVPLWPL
jgi:hypothetical protein